MEVANVKRLVAVLETGDPFEWDVHPPNSFAGVVGEPFWMEVCEVGVV